MFNKLKKTVLNKGLVRTHVVRQTLFAIKLFPFSVAFQYKNLLLASHWRRSGILIGTVLLGSQSFFFLERERLSLFASVQVLG